MKRLGVGSPSEEISEPSVPPRIGTRSGSIPSARSAASAAATTSGNCSTKRRMFGYCARTSTATRARGSVAATSSAVRRSSATCSASSSSSKSRTISWIVAFAAVPSIAIGWMKPSRPEVVSGVSRSEGRAARIRAAIRAALTSLPVAKPGWTSWPVTVIVALAAVKVSSCSSPRVEPSTV